MDYIYLPEKNAENCDIIMDVNCVILCYSINTCAISPFLQVMLKKGSFSNDLTLPSLYIDKNSKDYVLDLLIYVKDLLLSINCNGKIIDRDMFKGFIQINGMTIALVNVTSIDTNYVNLTKKSTVWFALPSEIINLKNVYNIPVDEFTVNLFSDNHELSLVYNLSTKESYSIPEVAYTFGEHADVDFSAIFGPKKQYVPNTVLSLKNKYHWFYLLLDDVTNVLNNKKEEDKTKKYGINRYALFHHDMMPLYNFNDISDEVISSLDSMCISNDFNHTIGLTTIYENFCSLSFDKMY